MHEAVPVSVSVREERERPDAVKLRPQTRRWVDAITDALRAHTGHDYRLCDGEEVGELAWGAYRLLCVWDGKLGRRYVLSVRRLRPFLYQASVGVRRGREEVEARLEVRLYQWGVKALLEDAPQVVGLMLGQRAGFFRGRPSGF
jgi:hypothetical protein